MSTDSNAPKAVPVKLAPPPRRPEEPLQVLTERTGSNWFTLSVEKGESEKPLKEFRSLVVDALTSENLVVLAGLGTSRCVRGAPSMDDLWDAMKAAAGTTLFQEVCNKTGYSWEGERGNFEFLLSRCVLHSKVSPADKTFADFLTKAESTIIEKCRFVAQGQELPIHEEFLRKISRRPTTKARTKIFTTNYDLCFETAAGRLGFAVIDGFGHTLPQQFDGDFFNIDYVRRHRPGEAPEFVEKVFQLYKLHGSVDWERQANGEMLRKQNAVHPVIIYPAENKFETSYQQPFLEVMSCFQTALRAPNTGLLVVGFGFNDAHIVQPILAAVRANAALKLMVATLGLRRHCEDANGNANLRKLEALAKKGDPRIALMDGKFDRLVELIPDLVAATAEDRHKALVKAVLDSVDR